MFNESNTVRILQLVLNVRQKLWITTNSSWWGCFRTTSNGSISNTFNSEAPHHCKCSVVNWLSSAEIVLRYIFFDSLSLNGSIKSLSDCWLCNAAKNASSSSTWPFLKSIGNFIWNFVNDFLRSKSAKGAYDLNWQWNNTSDEIDVLEAMSLNNCSINNSCECMVPSKFIILIDFRTELAPVRWCQCQGHRLPLLTNDLWSIVYGLFECFVIEYVNNHCFALIRVTSNWRIVIVDIVVHSLKLKYWLIYCEQSTLVFTFAVNPSLRSSSYWSLIILFVCSGRNFVRTFK